MPLVVVNKYDWGVEKGMHSLQTWEGVFLNHLGEASRVQGISGFLSTPASYYEEVTKKVAYGEKKYLCL